MTSVLLQPAVQPLNAPTVHRLPNGLTIVAEQMPIEAVNLNIWLRVGSAMETDAINGMAHFLEHMIFKGTHRLASGEFERRVEERGAVMNAATSQDYTHYYTTTAPQDFADLAPLQIEVVMNAAIPSDSFERERQVVLEEILRSQDNPRRRTFQQAIELTLDRLPYRRQVLGPTAVIEQLTAQQMRDFHAQWYRPENITAVAVGNLPADELIQIVADGFARADRGQPRPADGSDLPALQAEDPFPAIVRQQISDSTLQQARLVMTWRVPGLVELDETYALDILASVLSHGRTSRLVKDLREQQGLVTHISASNMTYQHQGVFYIAAHLPVENLERVEAAIAEHLHQLRETPVSEAEIQRIRTRVANHFVFGNETPSDRSGLYGYYQTLVGDLAPAISYAEKIQAVDAGKIQDAARRYLSPTAYAATRIEPQP